MPQFTDLHWTFSPVCNNNLAVKDRCSLACLEQTVVCDATRAHGSEEKVHRSPNFAVALVPGRPVSVLLLVVTPGHGSICHPGPAATAIVPRAAFSSTALIYRASSTSHGQFPSRKPSVGVILKKPAGLAGAI
jgi:hypothetical protein